MSDLDVKVADFKKKKYVKVFRGKAQFRRAIQTCISMTALISFFLSFSFFFFLLTGSVYKSIYADYLESSVCAHHILGFTVLY